MPRKRDDPANQPSAYSKALGLLARREHSERQLKTKLAHKGYERGESAAALDRLKAQEFLNDTRFAGALIRTRIGQGHGPRRMIFELRGHGLSDLEIRALIDAEAPDWTALARTLYRRRFGSRPVGDRAERNRRAQFLLRRGFDAATVRLVTRAEDLDDSADEFD